MDLRIKKDKRSKRCQKVPHGVDAKKAKSYACKDITKSIRNEGLYTINYIQIENKVLSFCNLDFEYLHL